MHGMDSFNTGAPSVKKFLTFYISSRLGTILKNANVRTVVVRLNFAHASNPHSLRSLL